MDKYKVVIVDDDDVALENLSFELQKDARFSLEGIWGIERSGFFNGREKWAKGFENQRV